MFESINIKQNISTFSVKRRQLKNITFDFVSIDQLCFHSILLIQYSLQPLLVSPFHLGVSHKHRPNNTV